MVSAVPHAAIPQNDETTYRVAECRPAASSAPRYADIALRLLDNGYEPLPIRHGKKQPAVGAWSTVVIDEAQVEAWCQSHGDCGVGLRTGQLVGVDIDVLDPDLAHQIAQIVQQRLGQTLMRVGRWPKRLLLYRTDKTFAKRQIAQFEVLAQGQQVVAFGIHELTRTPYDWPLGETPLEVPLDALAQVDEALIDALVAEVAGRLGAVRTSARVRRMVSDTGPGPARDVQGMVVDGRDSWLSAIAFHALNDAIDRSTPLDPQLLSETVWARFLNTTDLTRTKQNGQRGYAHGDAVAKVHDKLRLHRDGRLPGRGGAIVEPAYRPPTLKANEAREVLDRLLARSIAAIGQWHQEGSLDPAPRIGIRATVGLGKSTLARRQIVDLVERLSEQKLPCRILNLVPSLALADETAAAWEALGLHAVVLRGYEARHPDTHEPMCVDVIGVRAAVAAGLDIPSSVCWRSRKQACPQFASCLKQRNRSDVARAQVVVAANDTLFTGFAGDKSDFAVVLIDEACWGRAHDEIVGLTVDALPLVGIDGIRATRRQDAEGAACADVVAARQHLACALVGLAAGDVSQDDLIAAGLDAEFCREARVAELAAVPKAGLWPGQMAEERGAALARTARLASIRKVIVLWEVLEALLTGACTARGKVWLDAPRSSDGQRALRIYRKKAVAADVAGRPILHLDATLRLELAETVLPGLEIGTVEAAAPHQHVRLIGGGFGKTSLAQDPRAGTAENQRRTNRLNDCVAYVRWQALRHAPGKVLVVTYKAIESAFAAIPGVETAHYNAVAGLDRWGQVAAMILIGRPLPSSSALHELTGAVLGRSVHGKYVSRHAGIWTQSDRKTSIPAICHEDEAAEVLRAAICDDEVMQALGRGRGVNRTLESPLEVHVLADVALPIAYDRVQTWEVACLDIVQLMLLDGIAVNSPAHATLLHPALFASVEAAESNFRRQGFNRQNPIGYIYREMTVKSAQYCKGGRGRGWQTAHWIAGTAAEVRLRLEAAIGPVAEWHPGFSIQN